MAMLITRFHKLIQSKTVWYIILGVIVISFVGFFTPTMRSGDKSHEQYAGELFGKKVSYEEYRHAHSSAYLWQVLSAGQMIQVTDQVSAALRQESWIRLVALRKAQEEHVLVVDKEVVRQIQAMPIFQNENGVFDPARYKTILQHLNVTPQQVEELFREQLTLSKLLYQYTQAALIPPSELTRAYHLYTDRFVLDYVFLPRTSVEKTVSVSREEAEVFFAQHSESFRMPAKVRVSYVMFPVKDFLDQVQLPEGAASQVYNRNIEQYRVENTNADTVAEYKPFEKVKDEITTQLQEMAALRLAASKATELVAEIAPKSEGDLPDFNGAAEAAGLTVKTLPAFGPDEDLPGVDSPARFRHAAFNLQADANSSFSDPVVGKEAVYVLSLDQRYESFIPAFDAVEKKVMETARQDAVTAALADRSLEIRKTVSEAIAAGADFQKAVKPFDLTVHRTSEFDITTKLDGPYADTLVPLCLNVQQGEVCEPAPVSGGVLIVYVAERKSTDVEVGLPAVRQELVNGLVRNCSQQLVTGWRESLLAESGFKDWLNRPGR